MGKQADSEFTGRSVIAQEDGTEVAYYDPTEAVEEHAASKAKQKEIGGIPVDEGEVLEQDENGKTGANSSGRIVAIPKRGQEEIFSHLDFAAVVPVSADDSHEAMLHVRRYLKRAGLSAGDFLSFSVTTHYYLAPLGKRECGWSFSFESKPFGLFPTLER